MNLYFIIQPRKAFEEDIIVDKLPLKVESLEIWGQKIIVGTDQGVLLQYDVLPDQMGTGIILLLQILFLGIWRIYFLFYLLGKFQVQIKEPRRGFAKKAVTNLKVIREHTEHPLLLSLSGSILFRVIG